MTATAQFLRAAGFTVRESEGGMEAVHLLEGGMARVDVLVTDVGLPGHLNGRQIAETAHQRRPDLPIVFITFYADALIKSGLGANMSVLAKPVAPNALAAHLRTALAARTMPDQAGAV